MSQPISACNKRNPRDPGAQAQHLAAEAQAEHRHVLGDRLLEHARLGARTASCRRTRRTLSRATRSGLDRVDHFVVLDVDPPRVDLRAVRREPPSRARAASAPRVGGSARSRGDRAALLIERLQRCRRDRCGTGELRLHIGRDAADDLDEPGHHLDEFLVRRGECRSEQRLVAGVPIAWAGSTGRSAPGRTPPRRSARRAGLRREERPPSRGSTNDTPSRYPWPRTSRINGMPASAFWARRGAEHTDPRPLDQPLGAHRLEHGEPHGARSGAPSHVWPRVTARALRTPRTCSRTRTAPIAAYPAPRPLAVAVIERPAGHRRRTIGRFGRPRYTSSKQTRNPWRSRRSAKPSRTERVASSPEARR